MKPSTRRRRCVTAWAALLVLLTGGSALHAQEVTVEAAEHTTLADVLQAIRDATGDELYADARHLSDEVFVSAGTYDAESLLAAVACATGLEQRRVGELRHLAETEEGIAVLFASTPEDATRKRDRESRLQQALKPLIDAFPFRLAEMPFRAADFHATQRRSFGSLTPGQQRYVNVRLGDLPPIPADTTVRLLSTFNVAHMNLDVWNPPVPDGWLSKPGKTEAMWREMIDGRYTAIDPLKSIALW